MMRSMMAMLMLLILASNPFLTANADAQGSPVSVGPTARPSAVVAGSSDNAMVQAGVQAGAQAGGSPAKTNELVSRCEAMKGGQFVKLDGASTWITDAVFHAETPERRANCEITAYVSPQVFVGIMVPATSWNGRYVFRGCGGSCGALVTEGACGRHVRDGYACVFTNMGHLSTQTDNHWARDSIQNQIDFGYRATHVAHIAGQAIVTAYAGRRPDYTYYYGCSTGGRQGLVEAQRFPEDFDGLVAIAPATIANFGRQSKIPLSINLRDGKTDLDVPLLYKAMQRACDEKDGVRDGLIQPADCTVDPVILLCKPGQTRGCLTQDKVDVARAFYARGAQRGSELNWIDNWTADAREPTEFAESRGDPATSDTFYSAGNPDLTALRDHGAKMMLLHGTTDLVVAPGDTNIYVDTTQRTMGGVAETNKFFRYFQIVGMDHCTGGDGAWAINYLPIIRKWVEDKQAPDRIVGKRPKMGVVLDYFGIDTDRLTPDQIAFSRPYYPYPLKAYYSGKGDPNDADSFVSGARPIGPRAKLRLEGLKPGTPTEIATQIGAIADAMEKAYRAAGLPAKNVADRIGKQLRFVIYNSDISSDIIRQAIAIVMTRPNSEISGAALTIIKHEIDSAS